MNSLYGYALDFIRMNGLYLKVESGTVRLQEKQLSSVAVRMLENNRISGVLDLSVERLDGEASLLYAIDGKRMLSQQLRVLSLNADTIYRLLIRIATIVEEARTYLLQEERFVLRSDLMFVGERIDDVHLLYLPVKDRNEFSSLQEQLKAMVLEWLTSAQEVPGMEWKRLMQDFNGTHWDLSALRKQWIKRIAEPNAEETDDQEYAESPVEPDRSGEAVAPENNATSPASAVAPESYRRQGIPWGHEYVRELIPLEEAATSHHLSPKRLHRRATNDRKSTIMIGAIVLLLAVSFGLLIPAPSAKAIFLGGIMLCTAGAGYWFWREWTREKNGESIEAELEDEAESDREPEPGDEDKSAFDPGGIRPNRGLEERDEVPPVPSALFDERTMRLADEERTTVLSARSPASPGAQKKSAYLLRTGGGGQERRDIVRFPYVIGRDPHAEWRQDEEGVSRLHCEITIDGNGNYAVTDLGSRNGSYLNGELLVPYKPYVLQVKDEIHIVETIYTFHTE